MPKKIYDIIPPKIAHKLEDEIESLSDRGKIKRVHKRSNYKPSKKRFPLREVLIGGGVIAVLLAVYFVLKLPKAKVQILPKTDTLTLEARITVDKSVDSIDASKKIIPARYIEEIEESWQAFKSTGSASNDSKASGTIKVYNKFSPSTPITLISGTHFLSDSGKYFVTLEKITIPGGTKNAPGSVNAKVRAKEPGPDYNIKPSKFSVPKLSGTPYYYSIWAESENAMAGGYLGIVKKVTKKDIEEAEVSLTKKLLTQAEGSLKNKLSPDNVLLEGALQKEIINASSDVKVDTTAEVFNENAKVKVSALVFKKQDLEKLVKEDVESQLSELENFLEKSLELNYSPELIDISKGKATINLQSLVKTYYKIDTDNLTGLFQRKSANQIEDIVYQMYGDKISQVKISFWPFWVNKAPKDKNRVKINLIFE